jgi:hypothetical protein
VGCRHLEYRELSGAPEECRDEPDLVAEVVSHRATLELFSSGTDLITLPRFGDTTTASRLTELTDICDGRSCRDCSHAFRRRAVGQVVRRGIGADEFERICALPDAGDGYAAAVALTRAGLRRHAIECAAAREPLGVGWTVEIMSTVCG